MTDEYAIETIKIAISMAEWNHSLDYTVAFEKAIKALEKQMPKKLMMSIQNVRLLTVLSVYQNSMQTRMCEIAVIVVFVDRL